MSIRRAVFADAAAIAEVHIASWRSTYVGLIPAEVLANLSFERRLTHWQQSLAASTELVFVAEEENKVVGFASGGKERGGDPLYTGELYAIYLLRTAQQAGVGRQLVQQVATTLALQGHRAMLVWVLKENPACAFYQKLGGQYLYEKTIEIGKPLLEVAYGWRDLTQI